MTDAMKPWQMGITIDRIKQVLEQFERYNKYAFSPFTQITKPAVAKHLAEGTMFNEEFSHLGGAWFTYTARQAKRAGKVKLLHGRSEPTYDVGDWIISNLTTSSMYDAEVTENIFNSEVFKGVIEDKAPNNVWVEAWADDKDLLKALAAAGGVAWYPKYFSTGEVMIVFKFINTADGSRPIALLPWEDIGIKQVKLGYEEDIPAMVAMVGDALHGLPFKNHYSNYNKSKSWSAVAIRGFSEDPTFIEKPTEVSNSKKWAGLVANELSNPIQDTTIAELFPTVRPLLEGFLGGRSYDEAIERVRLMNLKPGGGELTRHTDQQDEDSGLADGKIARFHFPIVTNPGVVFTSWHHNNGAVHTHMEVGKCYYLDVRKPHSAVNSGNAMRTHLVVDVISNAHVRALLGR